MLRCGATFVNLLDEPIRRHIAPPAITVLINGGPNIMYVDAGAFIEPGRLAEGPHYRSIYGDGSGYVEVTSPWNVVRRNAKQIRGRRLVRVFVGDQDRLLENNRRFHALLDELGVGHEFIVVPGAEHSYDDKAQRLGLDHFAFWSAAFERAANQPLAVR